MKDELKDLTQAFVSRPGHYGFFEVTSFDCPSFLMFTANDCPRSEDILVRKSFEPQSMRLWCALCRSATAIIDVGAQVGVYSLAAAALRDDIPVHAFEPNPYAFARLRINTQINKFDNIVEHRLAVAHTAGVFRLKWIEKGQISSGGSAVLASDFKHESLQSVYAETLTLDDALKDQEHGDCPLIKIDVEGAEHLVFDGMPTLLRARPDIILETFSSETCEKLNALLLPMGYTVWGIDEAQGPHRQDGLTAAQVQSANTNQFLSVRDALPAESSFR